MYTSSLVPLHSLGMLESLIGARRELLFELAERIDHLYAPFRLPKGGGGFREIDNPLEPLKSVQRSILRNVLSTVPLPPTVLGGVPGRSVRQNAAVHVNQPVLVALDIRACFPSISHRKIYSMFTSVFGASRDVASLLTRLVSWRFRLPQGSPCSPMLCNLVLLPVHLDIKRCCDRYGLHLSQWVDDIAISGSAAHRIVPRVDLIVRRHGFRLAPAKTRVSRHWSDPQVVTGLVVNDTPGRSRAEREELRRLMISLAGRSLEFQQMESSIRGQIAFAASINPRHGSPLLRLLMRIQDPGHAPVAVTAGGVDGA